MKKLVFAALVAGCSGMVFGQASFGVAERAESSDIGKWYVNPAGGFMFFEQGLNVKRTGYAALRLGYDINDVLSFEVGGLVAPFIVSDPDRAKHGKYKHTMWGHTRDWRGVGQMYGGTADALIHFDRSNRYFDPYVRAGLGLYGASEHIFGDNFMAFVPRAGVGFQSHLTDNLALRAESIAHCFVTDNVNWAGSVELGLVYRFGGDNGNAGGAGAGNSRSNVTPAPVAFNPAAVAATTTLNEGLTSVVVEDNTAKFDYNLNFEYDASVINPRYFAALDQAIDTLKAYPNTVASIEGHTDRRTGSSPAYNMDLSMKRAKAVEAYFISKGIAASRLQAKGFGFNVPKVTPDLVNGNPENRRVEIVISAK